MNLLSVGAAYGLMVLVFQKGYLAGLFGFQQVDTIEAWIPLFLFSVLFGLSMDYHVFLLSRIRERFDQTGDNTDSIVFGVGTTSRIITGAALIMVAVFGGFAAGNLVMFQQMGFGLAVCSAARRDPDQVSAGARRDAPARPLELVSAETARMDPERRHRGRASGSYDQRRGERGSGSADDLARTRSSTGRGRRFRPTRAPRRVSRRPR